MGEYIFKLPSFQGSSFTVKQVNQSVDQSIKHTLLVLIQLTIWPVTPNISHSTNVTAQ